MQKKFKNFFYCFLPLLVFALNGKADLIPYEVSGQVPYYNTGVGTSGTGILSGSGMIAESDIVVPHVPYVTYTFDLSQFTIFIDNNKISDNATGTMSFIVPYIYEEGEDAIVFGTYFGLGALQAEDCEMGTSWKDNNKNGIPLIPQYFTWANVELNGNGLFGDNGTLTLTRSVSEPSMLLLTVFGFTVFLIALKRKKGTGRAKF